VFFLTDGYVGNDQEIVGGSKSFVEALEGRGQRARVFGFGVGSSPNRHLLEGLSPAGKGVAVYASTREDPAMAVNRFYRYIDRAVLTDVKLVWGEMGAAEIFPQPLPDLFASHPIVVHGRYRKLSKDPIELHARSGEQRVTLAVERHEVRAPGERGGVLGALWARAKVTFLEEESWLGTRPNAAREITELGLSYDLVTPYTSFVAVDESRRVSSGDPRQLTQPVEVPEGVDGIAAGARQEAPVTSLAPPMQQPGYAPLPEQELRESDEAPTVDAPTSGGADSVEADRGPRGCNCRSAGGDGGGRSALLLALAALVAALGRRRQRRA
jgi:Ca-activated chloride channel family protein